MAGGRNRAASCLILSQVKSAKTEFLTGTYFDSRLESQHSRLELPTPATARLPLQKPGGDGI